MIDSRRRLRLSEIELQCGFTLKAYGSAISAFHRRDVEGFWCQIQILLAAAFQIRQLLDPGLRDLLLVPDRSVLLSPEFDTVSDLSAAFAAWVSAHPRGPLRLSNFGPQGVSPADRDVFTRFFDPERSLVIVYGTVYELPPLLSSIAELQAAVSAKLRQLQAVV